jgi:hypothetical protein
MLRKAAQIRLARRKAEAAVFRADCNLGWSAVRVRDFNGRGFKEQVRGYVRDARAVH